ncbi:hypothetical protein D6764_05145 [Candidatus Woesearchaeota archaeon]|nr:MAG: hypothetical protein D6764_05145 [Candidatus Woesearchaeota archaeon]
MKKILVALLALFVSAVSASAATYTVPDDYATIQAAVDAASDGDSIFVKAGFYAGAVVNKAVEIYGEPGTVVNVRGTVVSSKGVGFYITHDDVSISDLKITGTGSPAIENAIQLESGHSGVTIDNIVFEDLAFYGVYGYDQTNLYVGHCTFANTGAVDDGGAIRIKNADNSVFEWNVAYGGARGIRLDKSALGTSDNNVVRYNVIHDMDQYGVGIYPGGSNNIVEFNRFYNLPDRGIQLGYYAGPNYNNIIRYNEVFNTHIDGIVLTNCNGGCIIEYNKVYNTAFDENTNSPSWTQPLHGGIAVWTANQDVIVRNNIVYDNGDGIEGNDGNCGIWVDASSTGTEIYGNSVWGHIQNYCDNDDSEFGEPGDIPEFTGAGAALALLGAGLLALKKRKA